MIDPGENQRLTEVGRGTAMGELLRRYWHPIGAATEFDHQSVKAVRLLGEDLVLYKDREGTYGLLERHCPHRRADLSYGFVDDCGLRCSYHGWAFDEAGRCISQPFEDRAKTNTRFRDSIKVAAYPVQEMAGLLFAYLGPLPAPSCPEWEQFTYEEGFRQIVFSDVPCNWLQCQENSIDPVHFEWLHSNWSRSLRGEVGSYAPTHIKIDFEEFDFGIAYHRMVEHEDETSANWQTLRLCILPNLFLPQSHFEWRVPVDDTTTLSVVWHYQRVPLEQEPYRQERIPHWYAPITDPVTGRWVTSHTINQDTVAWVGQGTNSDREHEHLGRSDLGVMMLRRQLLADLEAVAEGRDPKGVIRDPAAARRVTLPFNRQQLLAARSFTGEEWRQRFLSPTRNNPDDYFDLIAGQPPQVRAAFEEAMGL